MLDQGIVVEINRLGVDVPPIQSSLIEEPGQVPAIPSEIIRRRTP